MGIISNFLKAREQKKVIRMAKAELQIVEGRINAALNGIPKEQDLINIKIGIDNLLHDVVGLSNITKNRGLPRSKYIFIRSTAMKKQDELRGKMLRLVNQYDKDKFAEFAKEFSLFKKLLENFIDNL